MKDNGATICILGASLLAAVFLVTQGDMVSAKPPAKPLDDSWWEATSWTAHDLDTWSNCTIKIPRVRLALLDQDVRLKDCDACEVTYARQATLKRNGSTQITPEEIARGKDGLSKLEALAKGGKRFVRIADDDGTYGRIVADMVILTQDGERIDVAEWIRANKYERPAK